MNPRHEQTDNTVQEATSHAVSPLAVILELLGFADDEVLSMGTKHKNGTKKDFKGSLKTVAELKALNLSDFADHDVWVGLLPTRATSGRGKAEDAVRIPVLFADLDIGETKCPDVQTIVTIISVLSDMLGSRPVYVVLSGHGMQPCWLIEYEDSLDLDRMRPLLESWGKLVKHVATLEGGTADSVYDAARILRVPGTVNWKDKTTPVATDVTLMDVWTPVSAAQIEDAVDTHLPPDPEPQAAPDRPQGQPEPERSCTYALNMIEAWKTDTPEERHPWAVRGALKLECLRRLGCLTTHDFDNAVEILVERMAWLCANTGERRDFDSAEVVGHQHAAVETAIVKVKGYSEYKMYEAVGFHKHSDGNDDNEQPVVWTTPKPITEGCPIPYPVDVLPEKMRAAVQEVAQAVMADPALPANAFLGAAAGLLGPITTVVIDGTWQTKCNGYFTVVAETGEVKSPSMRPAHTVLETVEDVLIADAEQEKITAQAMLPIVQNNLKTLQREESPAQTAVVRLQAQVNDYQKILRRDACLVVDDVTPERLAELLADNNGRIIAWNDEGSLLSHLLGLYSTSPNLDVWLKSWGGENLVVERKGGGGREKTSLRVREPIMTIVSAVQPVTIRRIGSDPRNRVIIERGVVARALFSWPPSTAGTRLLSERDRDADLDYQHVGPWSLHLQENHRLGEKVLAMATDAHQHFADWHDRIEAGLPAGGTYAEVRAFAVKYREYAARIAGLFARLEDYRTVQKEHIVRATKLIDYHLANAEVVVEAWAEDAAGLAITLLAKLRRRDPMASTTVRHLYRDVVRARHRDVLAALEILDHAGWVKPANTRTGYGSDTREIGKESPVVLLNPAIWEAQDAR